MMDSKIEEAEAYFKNRIPYEEWPADVKKTMIKNGLAYVFPLNQHKYSYKEIMQITGLSMNKCLYIISHEHLKHKKKVNAKL